MSYVSLSAFDRPPTVTAHVTLLLAGCTGLPVGSFLTVVAHRVPAGQSILTPRSRCPSCRLEISARSNIPVVSYLLQRGRCRNCGARIPARYPVIEIATAALFFLVALRVRAPLPTAAFCVFAAGIVVLSAIDLEHLRLPSSILAVTLGLGGTLLAAAAVHDAQLSALLSAAVAALAVGAAFLVVHLAAPHALGRGDVRLAALCAGFVGWFGGGVVVVFLLTSFLLAGATGVVLLASGHATRHTRLAFGPFLGAGALIGICAGAPLLHLWLH